MRCGCFKMVDFSKLLNCPLFAIGQSVFLFWQWVESYTSGSRMIMTWLCWRTNWYAGNREHQVSSRVVTLNFQEETLRFISWWWTILSGCFPYIILLLALILLSLESILPWSFITSRFWPFLANLFLCVEKTISGFGRRKCNIRNHWGRCHGGSVIGGVMGFDVDL